MAAGSQIRDRAFIARALQELVSTEEEFPIKVEGTKTLPYSAILIRTDAGTGECIVKLVRPLPPALAEGAVFEMVFATQDKRYEGRITYLGREGYLQYRFLAPLILLASDRRLWKRYPIRPRENFQVAAQDSDILGHGLTGPLVNLSMGGLALRVDRMLRLEDGMPVRPRAALFDQGKVLSLLRIRGFPKGEVLEARGTVVRVHEANSELMLGIQFTGLGDAERLSLGRLLETRERQAAQGSGGVSATSSHIDWPGGSLAHGGTAEGGDPEASDPDSGEAAQAVEGPEEAGMAALQRLDRRCTPVMVVSQPGEDRDSMVRGLEAAGYLRMTCASDLFEAHAKCKEARQAPVRLLLVDLEPSRADGLEPMGAVRHLEPLLRSFGEVSVAFTTRESDPMLELMGRPGFAALALEEGQGAEWGEILDGLLNGMA